MRRLIHVSSEITPVSIDPIRRKFSLCSTPIFILHRGDLTAVHDNWQVVHHKSLHVTSFAQIIDTGYS